ncbi:hypothetical protein CRD_01650 [Raphidiopsis brookii D9]|nr:hypothetical protein CRD_01650 [Raphidiopsis brookii D9]
MTAKIISIQVGNLAGLFSWVAGTDHYYKKIKIYKFCVPEQK